ncbi:MAG: hypothetical protein VKJ64_21575 [Leptolyngbyaceae bacterium]|nr:hypothetical protein [Leptolyngbyaceae bacterium]
MLGCRTQVEQRVDEFSRAIATNQHQRSQSEALNDIGILLHEPEVEQMCGLAYRLVLMKKGTIRTLPSVQLKAAEWVSQISQLALGTSNYSPLELFAGFLRVVLRLQNQGERVVAFDQWGETHYHDTWVTMTSELNDYYVQYSEQIQSALLIVLSAINQQYGVRGWLIYDMDRYRKYHESAQQLMVEGVSIDKSYPLDEALAFVPRYLTEALRWCVETPEIHVFVPGRLVNHAFEQCSLPEELRLLSEIDEIVGHDYPVLVRIGDRLNKNYRYSTQWRIKGEAYLAECKNGNTSGSRPVFLRMTPDATLDRQAAQNALGIELQGLSQTGSTDNFVFTLMKKGLPFAIWERGAIASETATAEIDYLLQQCCLPHLPRTVQEVRCGAAVQRDGEPYQIRDSVSLLWDDPFLVPPNVWEKPGP